MGYNDLSADLLPIIAVLRLILNYIYAFELLNIDLLSNATVALFTATKTKKHFESHKSLQILNISKSLNTL